MAPSAPAYGCGHTAARSFRGPPEAQARQLASWTQKCVTQVCRSCFRKSKEVAAAAAAKANAKAGFGRLVGTPARILWAEQIRSDFAAAWREVDPELSERQLRDLVALPREAVSWIDLRKTPPVDLLLFIISAALAFDGEGSFDEYLFVEFLPAQLAAPSG